MLKQISSGILLMLRQPKKRKIIFIALAVVVVALVIFSGNGKQEDSGQVLGEAAKIVETVVLGQLEDSLNNIQTSGVVKSETKVDIIALNSGTVSGIFFNSGDRVSAGQVLVELNNETVASNFNSASANYLNTQQNLSITQRLLDESVKQAELNLANAKERVNAAKIGRDNAKSNLTNNKTIQLHSRQQAYQSGIASFVAHLGSLTNALAQIDYILGTDGSAQLPGIAPTLSVLDSQALYDAKNDYIKAKHALNEIGQPLLSAENIVSYFGSLVSAMEDAQKAIENTAKVLEATIPNEHLSLSALLAQKNAHQLLRQSFFAEQSAALATQAKLQNLDSSLAIELNSFESALKSAESGLASAQISMDNAQASLASAINSRQSQVLSSATALSAAEAQFRIAQKQLNDLSIVAPIPGEITFKSVEYGSQLSPGQKVAEVSQSNLVKVIVNLSSDNAYKVKLGSTAVINNNLEGTVSAITPAADPLTRKIKVEIIFINQDAALIPETFVDVAIPATINPAADDLAKEEFSSSVFIPLKSVIIGPTEQYVFIYLNGLAVKKNISTGNLVGDLVEITSGLVAGDELIVAGHHDLKDGQAVSKSG